MPYTKFFWMLYIWYLGAGSCFLFSMVFSFTTVLSEIAFRPSQFQSKLDHFILYSSPHVFAMPMLNYNKHDLLITLFEWKWTAKYCTPTDAMSLILSNPTNTLFLKSAYLTKKNSNCAFYWKLITNNTNKFV